MNQEAFYVPSYNTRIQTRYRRELSVINDDLNKAIRNEAAEVNHTSGGREWSLKLTLSPGAQNPNQELINWVTTQYARAGWKLIWCADNIVFINYHQELATCETSITILAP
jgi:hypothetical protein